MPTLEELKAKPGWAKLSPEAKALAEQKFGKPATARDPVKSFLGTVGDMFGNVATGVGKDLGNAVVSTGETMGVQPGSTLDDLTGLGTYSAPAMANAHAAIGQPQGVAQSAGAGVSHLVRSALPVMVAGPMAAPLAVGAATGGMEYAEGGSPGESIMAGLGGGIAQKLLRARQAAGGASALRDLQKSNARELLPQIQERIAEARGKGAVPGHGTVPKSLLDELSNVMNILASEDGAEGAGSLVSKVAGSKAGQAVTGAMRSPLAQKLLTGAAGGAGLLAGKKLLSLLE